MFVTWENPAVRMVQARSLHQELSKRELNYSHAELEVEVEADMAVARVNFASRNLQEHSRELSVSKPY